MMRYTYLMLFLFSMVFVQAFAQQKICFEYHSGVVSGLHYNSDVLNSKNDYGASFGGIYTRFLNAKWGVETGLLLGLYKTHITPKQSKYLFELNELDDMKHGFKYQVFTDGYREQVNLITAEFPIKLTYDSAISKDKNSGFYFGLGLTLVIPIVERSHIAVDELNVKGYYPNYDVVIEDLPQHGFGKIKNLSSVLTTDFRSTLMLSADGGVYLKTGNHFGLYMGVYGDFSLLDLNHKRVQNNAIVNYSPNGLPSQISLTSNKLPDVKRVNMMSFGVEIKIPLLINPKHLN